MLDRRSEGQLLLEYRPHLDVPGVRRSMFSQASIVTEIPKQHDASKSKYKTLVLAGRLGIVKLII